MYVTACAWTVPPARQLLISTCHHQRHFQSMTPGDAMALPRMPVQYGQGIQTQSRIRFRT